MIDGAIAIILGASDFPKSSFSGSHCFLNSAKAFEEYFIENLSLGSKSCIKNLFNSELSLSSMLNEIEVFLESFRTKPQFKNLLIYYVGHGAVTTKDDNYYLAIKDTDSGNPYHSSLPIDVFSSTLKNYANSFRKFIILDCCFAASAVSSFQTNGNSGGTLLLCASGKWEASQFLSENEFTMFFDSFIQILNHGNESNKTGFLNFKEVYDLTRGRLINTHKKEVVKPEIHTPEQVDEDISETPVFPNFATKKTGVSGLEELISKKYFDESLFEFQLVDEKVLRDFSCLFSYFLTEESKSILQNKMGNFQESLIENLCLKIVNSESAFPILVDGYTGTGKSLLLSLIYLGLARNKALRGSHCPVYINLHYYEYLIYQTEDIRAKAEDQLKKDIDEFLSTMESHNREIILIVDGADEYIEPKVDLFEKVLEHERFQKKIIGLRRFKSEKLKRNVPFPGEPEMVVSLNGVIKEGNPQIIEKIVQAYAAIVLDYGIIEKNDSIKDDNLKEHLSKYIENLGLYEVDLFSLRLLTEVVENPYRYPVQNQLSNFSSILSIYCQGRNGNSDLDDVARMAFEIFNSDIKRTSKEIDNDGWKLIGSHHSVRNYLIARHVYNLLNSPKKDNLSAYNFVYPHEVNSYIKQIVNADLGSQKRVFQGIKEIWEIVDKSSLNTRTHLAYLLGRFSHPFVAESAFQFLSEIESSEHFQSLVSNFEKYETHESKADAVNPKDRPKLLFLRTIYISLIYLGRGLKSAQYSKKYIEFCIRNPYQENLNRGFHLEYYGDIPYHPGESENLQHEDNPNIECDLTFNKLIHKVNLAVSKFDEDIEDYHYYPMFEVEIFTLCSLAQHRSIRQKNKLKDNLRVQLKLVLDSVIEQKVLNEDWVLWDYIIFVHTIVCNPLHVNQGHLYNLINNLKRRNRRGWEVKGKMDLHKVERVASHVWSAEDIAFFFLPEKSRESGYDKLKIVTMLHFHDSAEAFTSDYIRGEKNTEIQRRELIWISIISSLGMVEEFAELLRIKVLYQDFEEKKSVNSKYANDCDKLECLLQAINYRIKGEIPIKVYEEFTKNLKKELKTAWGKRVERVFKSIKEGDYIKIEKEFLERYNPQLV